MLVNTSIVILLLYNVLFPSKYGYILYFLNIVVMIVYGVYIIRKREILYNNMVLYISIITIFILLSLLYTRDFSNSLNYLIYEFNLPVISMLFVSITSKNRDRVKLVLSVGLVIALLYGLYQFVYGFNINIDIANKYYQYMTGIAHRKRLFSVFISPAIFASYLLLMIPIGRDLYIQLSERSKILGFGFVLLYLFNIIFTGSVSALIAIIVFIFIFYARNKKWKRMLKALAVTLIILIFIIAVRWKDYGNFNIKTNTIKQRIYNVAESIKMIRNNPILGTGMDTFRIVSYKYRTIDYNDSRYVHNMYLQIWNELGIVPFLIVIIILARVVYKGSAQRNIYYFGFTLFMIHIFFEYTGYYFEMLLFGVIIFTLANTRIKRLKNSVVIIIMEILIVLSVYVDYRYLMSDIYYRRAMNSYRNKEYNTAYDMITNSLKYNEYNSKLLHLASVIESGRYVKYNNGDYLEASIGYLKKSIKYSPGNPFYFRDLGMLYRASKQPKLSLKANKKFKTLYPAYSKTYRGNK